MLSNAGLGKEFWAEAITYACHLINHLPSAVIGGKTPFEKWYGKPAEDYGSLYVFSSIAYYHVRESKLEPRAKKALFMGITSGVKGYRLWCPETRKVIFSRDVTFDKSALTNKVTLEEAKQIDGASKQVEFEGKIIFPTQGSNKKTTEDFPLKGESVEEEVPYQEPQPQLESIATGNPERTIRKPARLIDMVACADPIAADEISTTYKDAVQSSEEDKRRISMDEEM